MEENLQKMFPEAISFFDELLNKSPDQAKNTQKWIKNFQQHEAWKKRLISKNKKKPNKKFTKHEETNTIFRKYLTDMVEEMGEPLLQYKHWEMHLRNNPIPNELKSAIENSEPLEQGIIV